MAGSLLKGRYLKELIYEFLTVTLICFLHELVYAGLELSEVRCTEIVYFCSWEPASLEPADWERRRAGIFITKCSRLTLQRLTATRGNEVIE